MTTARWAPNQAAVAQVETYTFTAPSSIGNTYIAAINGKTVTYSSVSGDTAATAATALFNLLNVSTGIAPELTEITFANPSSGVVTAAARTPGVPFANVTVNGVSGQGLVLSTGNGLANGIATAHTTPNYSPSDVFDAQNWLRITGAAPGVRAIPVNGDDVVVADSTVPMLWNLDQLSGVQFQTYTRRQSMEGAIGLPRSNPGGYTEWRATDFKFSGPQGSVPAGGLQMVLGLDSAGAGPSREQYDVGSQPTTLTVLAAGQAEDEYGVRFIGQHTANAITVLGGVSVGVAVSPGEVAGLGASTVGEGSTLGVGKGVTWTAGTTLTVRGGTAILAAAPATLLLTNGGRGVVTEDSLTWAAVTGRNGSSLDCLAGGTITTLTLETGSRLDKSQDARALTITNSTIDGDTCIVDDPLNAITWTNATSVKQQVASGPFRFTGTRTVKVT